MPTVENRTFPAGNDIELDFDVDPDEGSTLSGAQVRWWMARSEFAPPAQATLKKSNAPNDGIEVSEEGQLKFTVSLSRAETLALIGDYYHEAAIKDADGNWVTVTKGTLTFERTLIRQEDE